MEIVLFHEMKVSRVDNVSRIGSVVPVDNVGDGSYVFREAPHFDSLGLPCQESRVFQVVSSKDGIIKERWLICFCLIR